MKPQIRQVLGERFGYEVSGPDAVRFFGEAEYGSKRKALMAAKAAAQKMTRQEPGLGDTVIPPGEILSVVSGSNIYQWQSQKGEFFAQRCQAATGLSTSWAVLPPGNLRTLREAIAMTGCRLVIIHAFLYRAGELISVAGAFPGVRFVVVNHSSLAYSALSGRDHFDHILASERQPNLFYALADDRIPLEHDRMIYLANPVRDHPAFHQERPAYDGPARIHICGRLETTKNHFTAATAIAMLAKLRPVRAVITIRNRREDGIDAYLQARGVEVESHEWVPWDDFPQFIADHVDLLIQPTLTESHNLVGIEHLMCGVPVLGSPSLRYLPTKWQRNPELPGEFAWEAEGTLQAAEPNVSIARHYGQTESDRCNRAFDGALNLLLS